MLAFSAYYTRIDTYMYIRHHACILNIIYSDRYWVTQKLPQTYKENHATFPIRIPKIIVQICGNFRVTQHIYVYTSSYLHWTMDTRENTNKNTANICFETKIFFHVHYFWATHCRQKKYCHIIQKLVNFLAVFVTLFSS